MLKQCGWLALTVIVLSACNGSDTGKRADDYLAPELRTRVENLKASVRESPTDQSTATERARTLFDWINAYAMSGGYVPVNATAVVAQINAYGVPAGPVLDQFVEELRLHDEHPHAVGTLVAEPLGPFTVRSLATFRHIYTVGESPVKQGGGFLVAKHFQTNNPPFQTDEPTGANFVSASSDNPAVRFTIDEFNVAGMHGGFRGPAPQLVFRVRGADLQPGDRVTITYGDKSQGGPGLRMPDFNSERMPFPLYVDLDGSNLWLSLPIQPIRLTGAAIAGVAGFAPSVLAAGEAFELSIRAEDRYGNRATGDIPDWQVRLDGETIAEVPSNNEAVVVTSLPGFDAPGVYRLSIQAADEAPVGATNPILVEDNPASRIYWGETHGHSGFAEGIGTPESYMKFARDDARLDFVTHSEHDIWMDDKEWETMRSLVKQYTEQGRFIAYLGYEWTVRQSSGGHHNVLFRTPHARDRVPSQFYPVLSSLYQGLREHNDINDVLIIPHAHQKADYRYSDPEMETLVEIMSMHGTFEWFGRMYLNHGHHVGFVAASDDHLGRPGYAQPKSWSLAQRGGLAAVFAGRKTTDDIFDALKALRAYATTGQRIILNFNVNGASVGENAKFAQDRHIAGRVIGTAPIRSVTVFKNDRVLKDYHYVEANDNQLALSFFSESYPFHPQDNPRGWRIWRGSIDVANSELVDVTMADEQNLATQYVKRDPDNPSNVQFSTQTRGDHSTLMLNLDRIGPDTTISMTLTDAREVGSGPPIFRRHQMIKGAVVELSAGDMEDGKLVHDMSFDGYKDAITLSRGGEMPLEASFALDDSDSPRRGDYYFMRVRQTDEGLAWSSPVWVGGIPPK